jgi:hypothetical protein
MSNLDFYSFLIKKTLFILFKQILSIDIFWIKKLDRLSLTDTTALV